MFTSIITFSNSNALLSDVRALLRDRQKQEKYYDA